MLAPQANDSHQRQIPAGTGWHAVYDERRVRAELRLLHHRRRDTTDGVSHRELSSDELRTPAVREIFELLVKQHPAYAAFELYPVEDWAMARKIRADNKSYQVHYGAGPVGVKDMLRDGVMRLIRAATFRAR